ncbi:MAG: hypothetical protein VW644_07710, partial [Alphaproteobacteria bacterium]
DVRGSKAMYLMDYAKDRQVQADFRRFADRSAEDVFAEIADDVSFVELNYGQVLLFSQTVMHGNRVNREGETRWSMNCRFKSVMSPYADKRLGEFFEPISLKPATQMALDYELPAAFDE